MKLNNRERTMVVGAGLFLALVGVYFLLLDPFLRSREELSEKLDYSYRIFREYQAILLKERTYQEQLQARRGEMVRASRLLLSGNTSSLAAAELSNKIRAFADEAGVSITRENVNQPVTIDHHLQISIQLNMSCDVIGLQEFLKKIEGDTNLLVVRSLEVNAPSRMRRTYRRGKFAQRGERRVESDNLRVTMTISGFIEEEEGSPGGGR